MVKRQRRVRGFLRTCPHPARVRADAGSPQEPGCAVHSQLGLPGLGRPWGLFLSCLRAAPPPIKHKLDLPMGSWGTGCDRKYLLGDCLMSATTLHKNRILVRFFHHLHPRPSLVPGTRKMLSKTLLKE